MMGTTGREDGMAVQQWEYLRLRAASDEDVTKAGEQGWELVSVVVWWGIRHSYFKRPKP